MEIIVKFKGHKYSFSGCADAINPLGPHTTAPRDVTPRVIDGEWERESYSPSLRAGEGRRTNK